MEPAREISSYIDVSGTAPVISGTDIRVSQIASEYEHMGMTPDAIVQAHSHLSLAGVHAALAYYYDHFELIRDEWKRGQALIDSLRDRYPSRVAQKLNG